MNKQKAPPLRLATVVIVAALAIGAMLTPGGRDTIKTGAGERVHRTLSEGSAVRASSLSRMKIDFNAEQRNIRLEQGEAVFEVAKDAARPFNVITPLATFTAIGTRFGVSLGAGVTVTVSEGAVRATVRGGKEIMLRAGEQLQVSDTEFTPPALTHVDAVSVLQWADGVLVCKGATIGEAAAEFNRHNVVQIEIARADIAARVLPGSCQFSVDMPLSFARTVDALSNITLIEDRSGEVLRLRLE